MTDRFLGRSTSWIVDLSFCFSFMFSSCDTFRACSIPQIGWMISFSDAYTDFPEMFFYFYDGTIKIQIHTYDLSWVGQSSTSLLKQGRYVTLEGRGDAWGILSMKYKFWSLINTRNIWKYLTLDQQKKFLDGSLQVRFLNLGILTMTNRTRPLLALNILFPKQVPCLLWVSNHLFN